MTSYISVEILTLFALSISLLNAANKNLIFFVARKIASPVVTNQKEWCPSSKGPNSESLLNEVNHYWFFVRRRKTEDIFFAR